MPTFTTLQAFRRPLIGAGGRMAASTMTEYQPNLKLDNMNPSIKKMEYAVRGPLVIRATALEKVG